MNREKIKPLIKGAITLLPGVKILIQKKTGGTIDSRYCYSVWLRHLTKLQDVGGGIPDTVAELGPGDSLGIGLAALLSGCNKYYGLDVIKYWDNKRNLKIFEDLVILLKNRTPIPDNSEFPFIKPEIKKYDFPSQILTESKLNESLSEGRLKILRKEICNIDGPGNTQIFYRIPWHDDTIIEPSSVDFVYSQSVLECVEDLDNTYNSINKWLKQFGVMSHSIDLSSFGITKSWNGHWTFGDLEWRIVKGSYTYLMNRYPFSYHISLHKKYGFEISDMFLYKSNNQLTPRQIAKKFKTFSEEELSTSGMYIISIKK